MRVPVLIIRSPLSKLDLISNFIMIIFSGVQIQLKPHIKIEIRFKTIKNLSKKKSWFELV